MKLQSFENMLMEYGITELEPDDLERRNEMFLIYKYSVILEGGFMELDNLEKWIAINFGRGKINTFFMINLITTIALQNTFLILNSKVYGFLL